MAFPYDTWPPVNTSGLDVGIAEPRVAVAVIVLSIACMMIVAGLYYAAIATWSAIASWLRKFLDHLPAHDEPGTLEAPKALPGPSFAVTNDWRP